MGDLPDLRADGVTVRFGGALAVNDVSFCARAGWVTSLIGPNGAGKTTTLNACSGIVRPSSGTITFGGHDVSGFAPQRRAQLGMGRTFQRMEMCESLSVEVNVSLGRDAVLSGTSPWRHLWRNRADRTDVRARTMAALDLCGLTNVATVTVSDLSTGQRRLVELARVIAGGFSFLLLDEPSSGLDDHETRIFGSILRRLVEDDGIGVLLVEHDMDLVMSTSEYIYVLDFGSLVFAGQPHEVTASSVVRASYLGGVA